MRIQGEFKSFLELQSSGLKNKEALEMFQESQNRGKTMALVHEKSYSDFKK